MIDGLLRFARCRIPGLHPGMDDLVSWADDATGRRRSDTHVHMDRCPRCRERARLIRASIESAAGHGPGPAESRVLDEVFRDLQIRMRAWSSLSGMTHTAGARRLRNPANQRITRAIELYFGREAASRIALAVDNRRSDQYLVPTVKPLFNAFLGARAADALAHHLVGTVV